jgi:hypothetical protein
MRREEAMRLYEYVPIYDPIVDDESVIDRVFGPEFYVVDEAGQLLTSAHNRNLLRRARSFLEHVHLDRRLIEDGLHELSSKAETLSQQDYEMAVRREIRFQSLAEDDFDVPGDLSGSPTLS